jgi:hypothetical protein
MSEPVTTSHEPPGSAGSAEFFCPICDYNLRGLPEARCPECGYRTTWEALANLGTVSIPWLFEHRSNPLTYLRTMIVPLWPWSFWSRLRPEHRINLPRLWVYIAISFVAGLTVAVTSFALSEFRSLSWMTNIRYKGPAPTSIIVIRSCLSRDFWESPFGGLYILYFVWPASTLGALMLLPTSMRRAKVRFGHVLRCVAYGAPVTACLFAAAIASSITDAYGPSARLLCIFAFLCWGVIWATVCLAVAYRKYLRFPHAIATAVASQIIAALVMAIILSQMASRWLL